MSKTLDKRLGRVYVRVDSGVGYKPDTRKGSVEEAGLLFRDSLAEMPTSVPLAPERLPTGKSETIDYQITTADQNVRSLKCVCLKKGR